MRRNAVALISLAVALFGLGYNTWRNETTEAQRNLRHASFQLIEHLGRLESIADSLTYAADRRGDAWVDGWGEMLTIRSLGQLLPAPVPTETQALHELWEQQFERLSDADRQAAVTANDRLDAQLRVANDAVLAVLARLD